MGRGHERFRGGRFAFNAIDEDEIFSAIWGDQSSKVSGLAARLGVLGCCVDGFGVSVSQVGFACCAT